MFTPSPHPSHQKFMSGTFLIHSTHIHVPNCCCWYSWYTLNYSMIRKMCCFNSPCQLKLVDCRALKSSYNSPPCRSGFYLLQKLHKNVVEAVLAISVLLMYPSHNTFRYVQFEAEKSRLVLCFQYFLQYIDCIIWS